MYAILRAIEYALTIALRLLGFTSVFVPTESGKVHAVSCHGTGDLPSVLLLHGLSASVGHYGWFLKLLAEKSRRVMAIDMPGHGLSDREFPRFHLDYIHIGTEQALLELIEEPVVLIGNSMGGAAAIRFAATHTDKVKALVLLMPGGAAMTEEQLARFRETFKLDSYDDALRFVDAMSDDDSSPLRYLTALALVHQLRQTRAEELLQSITVDDLISARELRSIGCPVYLLWGGQDEILFPDGFKFFQKHLHSGTQSELVEH